MTRTRELVRDMPYRVRLDRYHRERDELFGKNANSMTQQQIDEAHRKLVEKWRI